MTSANSDGGTGGLGSAAAAGEAGATVAAAGAPAVAACCCGAAAGSPPSGASRMGSGPSDAAPVQARARREHVLQGVAPSGITAPVVMLSQHAKAVSVVESTALASKSVM